MSGARARVSDGYLALPQCAACIKHGHGIAWQMNPALGGGAEDVGGGGEGDCPLSALSLPADQKIVGLFTKPIDTLSDGLFVSSLADATGDIAG